MGTRTLNQPPPPCEVKRIEHALGWHCPDLSDFEFRLVIRGRPFVLKNSKRAVVSGGRPRIIPSKRAGEYLADASLQLSQQWAPLFATPIPEGVAVNARLVTYCATRHRADASNLYQAPEDALQAAGVLTDDYQIASHDGSRRRYDKQRPRVEVTLTPARDEGHGQRR